MKKNKYRIVIGNNIYTAEQVPVDDDNGKSEEKDSLQNCKESCYNSEVIT